MYITLNSKGNEKLISNYPEVNDLSQLPVLIHESILRWENKKRLESANKYFSGYEELASLLDLHPQTLRKYTNISNPKFPAVNKLLTMCKVLDDFTAWDYLSDYSKNLRIAS